LLQQGAAVNPVGVYVPLADVYAKFGIGGLNMDVEIERQLGTQWLLELRRSGYDFDFLNDAALAHVAMVEAGVLRAGTGAYRVVIVPDVQFMPPESLEVLLKFVQNGGCVMFAGGHSAVAAPGLKDNSARSARVKSILTTLRGTAPALDRFATCGKGKVFVSDHALAVLAALPAVIPPDFEILQAGDSGDQSMQRARENVGFLHRQVDDTDLYFISNISAFLQDLSVRFPLGHKQPQRWNPESGELDETLVFSHSELASSNLPATEIQLRLAPYESCFVVFSPGDNGPIITHSDWRGPLGIEKAGERVRVRGLMPKNGEYFLVDGGGKTHRFNVKDVPQPTPLNGPWRLTLGEKTVPALAQLQSWNDLPEGKDYSGWGVYETDFEVNALGEEVEWSLDLGVVHETAEVVLNGINLGAAWKGARILPCRDALKVGINHLKIEVGNLWIHHVQSLPKPDRKALAETFGIRWGTYGEVKPAYMPPSGLLGPVQLLPQKQWVATL
jgi:hypothetical protein